MSGLEQLSGEIAVLLAPKVTALVIEQLGEKLKLNEDRLMTVAEAAKYLGFHRDTIYRLVKARVLKKAPGLTDIRIRQSILDAYGK